VGAGEPGPALVGSEEGAHLVLGRAAVRGLLLQAPDELQVADVGGRDLVVAPLPVQREHLDRPAADPRDGP